MSDLKKARRLASRLKEVVRPAICGPAAATIYVLTDRVEALEKELAATKEACRIGAPVIVRLSAALEALRKVQVYCADQVASAEACGDPKALSEAQHLKFIAALSRQHTEEEKSK